MISKALARVRRRPKQPMEVVLTLKMNFGDRPDDALTLIQNRRVPLVGSVFDNRDRLLREFLRLLLKASAKQPRVMRGLLMGKRPRT